ncbi:ATP-binding protein [Pseudoalteromonas ulvae]|uniref:histidine kinase n=1 Tax=Pseudoalteromonas ulvae TaxID=107327 RepID=A0A244CUN3_PSEDV|nr:ATP-binding protein [Pseudoalteromonas ulvae]OUL59342.1 hypothetical protein B1199_03485 [Pseudoalteromonas ulvae]
MLLTEPFFLLLIRCRIVFVVCLALFAFSLRAAEVSQSVMVNNPTTLFPQAAPLLRTIDNEGKISNGVITSAVELTNGQMWFGTQNGLVYFDGVQFESFPHQPNNPESPAANYIVALAQDSQQGIWMATRTSGLSRYSPVHKTYQHLNTQSQPWQLQSDTLRTLMIDSQNQLWAGHELGVERVSLATEQVSFFEMPVAGSITYRIYEASNGDVWACTTKGVFKKAKDNDEFIAISTLTELDVRAVYQDKQGTFWLGSRSGLWFWDGKNKLDKFMPPKTLINQNAYVRSIVPLENGQVWVATYGNGLWVLNAKSHQFERHLKHDPSVKSSLVFDEIGTAFLSKNGALVIGTWGAGLQVMNANTASSFVTLRHSLQHDNGLSYANVRTVLELNNGLIAVGTTGQGVDIIDPQRGRVSSINRTNEGKALTNVVSLAQQQSGTIWAGTASSGLVKLDLDSKRFIPSGVIGINKGAVLRMLVLRNQTLVVGTAKGVCLVTLKNNDCQYLHKKSDGQIMLDTVTSLLEDQFGALWISTHNGVYRLAQADTELDHFKAATIEHSLSHNYVLGMASDFAGSIWLTTSIGFDQITNLDQADPVFTRLKQRLPITKRTPGANMLLDSRGRIWSATSVLDIDAKQYMSLGKNEGVDFGVAWLGAYTKMRNGLMLFGGTQGLLIIDPDEFEMTHLPSDFNVTRLDINGQDFPLSRLHGLKFLPDENNVRFHFALSDLLFEKTVKYEYWLEGETQEKWQAIDSGIHFVQFNNLTPGHYVLRMRAKYPNYQQMPVPIAIKFTVLPAFWQTWWFKILVVLLITGVILQIFRWRIGLVRAQATKLEDLVNQRTREIQVINQIGRQFTLQLLLDELLNDIYGQINQIFQADRFGIGILNPEKNLLEFDYAVERGVRYLAYSRSLDEPGQLAVYAVKHNQSILINDYEKEYQKYYPQQDLNEHTLSSGSKEIKAVSMMYVPMQHNGEMLGVISIQSVVNNSYSEHDLTLLESLAAYATIAVSNARSHLNLMQVHQNLKNSMEELKHTQEQLIMHEKMAYLGQLVAGVAHEVNTPLGITVTAASVLDDHTQNLQRHFSNETLSRTRLHDFFVSAEQSIQLIKDNTERAASLVQRFKQVAVESSSDNETQIKLDEFIDGVVAGQQSLLDLKGIAVEVVVPDILEIQTYPGALAQVLFSLLNNAIMHAFSDHLAPKVLIEVKVVQAQCFISVRDNGKGIDPQVIDKIFDPFFTTNRLQGGTGLGLSITFNLVHQVLQGTIQCHSELGSGCEFMISLPLVAHRTK